MVSRLFIWAGIKWLRNLPFKQSETDLSNSEGVPTEESIRKQVAVYWPFANTSEYPRGGGGVG